MGGRFIEIVLGGLANWCPPLLCPCNELLCGHEMWLIIYLQIGMLLNICQLIAALLHATDKLQTCR